MKTDKRLYVPIILLFLVMIIVAYHLGAQHEAAKSYDNKTGPSETTAPPSSAPKDEYASLRNKPRKSATPRSEASNSVENRTAIASEQRQRLMRNISENLKAPGMNQMIHEQQRVLIKAQYENLTESLGLNAEETNYFVDLLTARQMCRVDMGMKLMTGMLSESEREEMIRQVGTEIDELNGEIDWFLNNEADSEYFQYYEQTEGERSVVNSISDQLTQTGDPIGKEINEALVEILHQQIRTYPFSVQFEENGEPVFSRFTDENINTFIEEMQELREPVLNEVTQLLNQEQLEVFASSFDQYISFYDQRLHVVKQFFNTDQ